MKERAPRAPAAHLTATTLALCALCAGASAAFADSRPFVDGTFEPRSPPLQPELVIARERFDPSTLRQSIYVRLLEDSTFLGLPIGETAVGRITVTGATIAEVHYRSADLEATEPGGSARFLYGLPAGPYAGVGRGLEGDDPLTATPISGAGLDALRFEPGGHSVDFYLAAQSDVDDFRIILQYPAPAGPASIAVELFVASNCPVSCGPQAWPPGGVRGLVVGSVEPSVVPDDGVYAGATELSGIRLFVRHLETEPLAVDLGEALPGTTSDAATLTVDNFFSNRSAEGDIDVDLNGPYGRIDGYPFPTNIDLFAVRASASALSGPTATLAASAVVVPSAPFSVAVGARASFSIRVSVPADQPVGDYQGTLQVFEDANGDGLPNDDAVATVPVRVRVVSMLAPDGGLDGGALDGGLFDGGLDGGVPDAGPVDAGTADAGATDAGTTDAGTTDAGTIDAGATDAGTTDAGTTDAGTTDAGVADAGPADGGADGGRTDGGAQSETLRGGACSCGTAQGGGGGLVLLFGLGVVALGRRRRGRAGIATFAWIAGLAWIASFCFLAAPARAQSAPDVNTFRPTTPDSGYVTVEGGRVLAPGEVGAGLVFGWAQNPLLRYRGGQRVGEAVSGLAAADFGVTFGALSTSGGAGLLQLGVAFPVLFARGARLDGSSLPAAAAGDVRFLPKVRLFGSSRFRLTLVAELTFPSGDNHSFAGESSVSFAPRLCAELLFGPWRAAFSLAYRFREAMRVRDVLFDDELTYRGAVAWEVLPRATLVAELVGGTSAVYPFRRLGENSMEAIAGARIDLTGGLSLLVGGGAGLLPGYGVPAARAFVGFGYASPSSPPSAARTADRDGDGVPDAIDECPDVPGPASAHGCPDRDGDGVPDHRDACPDVAARTKDGCPPKAVEPTTPKPPPVADRDGDGVLDDKDACPDKPGPAKWQGCPDSDGDGIPDHLDRCPYEKEDFDRFADEDGCPDPDNDFDGVPDAADPEPNEPKLPPALVRVEPPPEVARETVRFVKKRMLIREKVHFKAGTRDFADDAAGVLDRVAAAIKAHDLIKVRVDGHVEKVDGWSADAMSRLSEQLAERVRAALVERGVEGDRLAIFGLGANRPLAAPNAKDAAKVNRRVEFVVVER